MSATHTPKNEGRPALFIGHILTTIELNSSWSFINSDFNGILLCASLLCRNMHTLCSLQKTDSEVRSQFCVPVLPYTNCVALNGTRRRNSNVRVHWFPVPFAGRHRFMQSRTDRREKGVTLHASCATQAQSGCSWAWSWTSMCAVFARDNDHQLAWLCTRGDQKPRC